MFLELYNRKSFIPSYRLTVTYTEIIYPARTLPNQTAKPVPETQKLAGYIYDFIKKFGARCYLTKKF